MRIIILLPSNHIYANFMAKEIIKNYPRDIAMIVESSSLIPKKTFYSGVKKYIMTSGFKYFFAQAAKQILFVISKFLSCCFLGNENIFYPYEKIASEYKIPIIKNENINSLSMIEAIKQINPDLIISLFFRQILRDRVLKLPRIGCLNIHPALLPQYRGVSPIFWAMANGEQSMGVTIHFMDKETDQGDIVSQRTLAIGREDTEHSLYLLSSVTALSMLFENLRRFEDNSLPRIKQKKEGSYFSFPNKDAVGAFRKRGYKFFRLKDFFQKS